MLCINIREKQISLLMKVRKDQIFTSPSDLNNFVSCKYHAFNDLNEHKNKLKKKDPPEDMKLWIRYGDEHEKNTLRYFKKNTQIISQSIQLRVTMKDTKIQ